MIIIGELINTSRKAVAPAVENKDKAFVQDLAIKQVENGADFVDINAGTFVHGEEEYLMWLTEIVQEVVEKPLCIDSPNPKAIEAALKVHKGKAIINSISAEKERYESIIPLVKEYQAGVVALCMDDSGMPNSTEQRLKIINDLVERLTHDGIPLCDIYLDPLVKPISVNSMFGVEVLDTIRTINEKYPGIHTTCGLSNVSFGLPNRKLLNQAFLVLSIANGMDSFILDPLDKQIMDLLTASKALMGKDDYCMEYLQRARQSG